MGPGEGVYHVSCVCCLLQRIPGIMCHALSPRSRGGSQFCHKPSLSRDYKSLENPLRPTSEMRSSVYALSIPSPSYKLASVTSPVGTCYCGKRDNLSLICNTQYSRFITEQTRQVTRNNENYDDDDFWCLRGRRGLATLTRHSDVNKLLLYKNKNGENKSLGVLWE